MEEHRKPPILVVHPSPPSLLNISPKAHHALPLVNE